MVALTWATSASARFSSPDCLGRNGVMHMWFVIAPMLAPITFMLPIVLPMSSHAWPSLIVVPDMPLIAWPCCHAYPDSATSITVPRVRVHFAVRTRFAPIILVILVCRSCRSFPVFGALQIDLWVGRHRHRYGSTGLTRPSESGPRPGCRQVRPSLDRSMWSAARQANAILG